MVCYHIFQVHVPYARDSRFLCFNVAMYRPTWPILFLHILIGLGQSLARWKDRLPYYSASGAELFALWIPLASYQIRKIACCACAGNAGNVFPIRIQRKALDMHVGIAKLLKKRSRHSRRMRNPQFYISGKRPMERKVYFDSLSPGKRGNHLCLFFQTRYTEHWLGHLLRICS